MRDMVAFRQAVLLAGLCVANLVYAADRSESLPNPLSLAQALDIAGTRHPELAIIDAKRSRANALYGAAQSQNHWRIDLLSRIYAVEPSPLQSSDDRQDYAAGIALRRRIFDFGYNRALADARRADEKRWQLAWVDAKEQHKIHVLEAFFAVMHADLRYVRENEAMATAFVRFDRARDQRELGKVSDVEVLEKENRYQKVRLRRYRAQAEQRHTREQLAAVLNSHELPQRLIPPKLKHKKIPEEFEPLWQTAQQRNPGLTALRVKLHGAMDGLRAARRSAYPVIDASVQAWSYSRDLAGRDRWQAGIEIHMPLWSGGAVQSAVAQAQAEWRLWRGELENATLQLRQALLETWLQLENLRVEREGGQVQLDYRDLYLDRSRALYELEVKTDLGDAMVMTSEARMHAAQVEFDTIRAWARLQVLQGQSVSLSAMQEQ